MLGQPRGNAEQRGATAFAKCVEDHLLLTTNGADGGSFDDQRRAAGTLNKQGRRPLPVGGQRGMEAQRIDLPRQPPHQARRLPCPRSAHSDRPTTGSSCASCAPSASS